MTSRHCTARPNRSAPIRLSPLEAFDLAPGLLAELTPHAGDAARVTAILRRWLEERGPADTGLSWAAGLTLLFSEYLTEVPADQLPVGELAVTAPFGTDDRRTA